MDTRMSMVFHRKNQHQGKQTKDLRRQHVSLETLVFPPQNGGYHNRWHRRRKGSLLGIRIGMTLRSLGPS